MDEEAIGQPDGSSPLARGLPDEARREVVRARIIPARAGFTVRDVGARDHVRDHPRSRGVYTARRPRTARMSGSSPLARGLLEAEHTEGVCARIIPARAGFTTPPALGRWGFCGSSPLARGLRRAVSHDWGTGRIIPARAGFTPLRVATLQEAQDHPRSRGVYDERTAWPYEDTGSSPLARGLRPYPGVGGGRRRIIPARAGFTCPFLGSFRTVGDHPRSRGVYRGVSCPRSERSGSSPLARGLLDYREITARLTRIIPARAGFTFQPSMSG